MSSERVGDLVLVIFSFPKKSLSIAFHLLGNETELSVELF